jgi:phage protein D
MMDNLLSSTFSGSSGISRPVFRISSEGVPLPEELLRACVSVSVSLNANQPGSFALQIDDPQLRWIRATDGLLQEGRRIEISLGYGLDLRSVFSGSIVSVGADLDDSGGLTIQVYGFDALHGATRESDYEKFLDEESDDLIVQKIATNVLGLVKTSVALQGSRNAPRFKGNVSAFQFLEDLAREYGCRFWVEDETLFFRPEREGGLPIHLRRRVDLSAFSVRLSTAGQLAEVEARAWDTTQKAAIVATARASNSFRYTSKLSAAGTEQASRGASGKSKRVLFANIQANTHEEAQRFADAELRRLRRNLITGDGATVGNPAIRVGTVLFVDDFGRFSGEYVVESARHEMNQGGYRTSFEVRQAL